MGPILRKQWNENHKKLTQLIQKTMEHDQIIELFLSQHRLLHASETSQSAEITLEDELVRELDETTFRRYPVATPDTRNSIAWHLWHITRIEDMTMNVLVHGGEQVFFASQWDKQLQLEYVHSGNEMNESEISELSERVDLTALLAYRSEVGKKTRSIVSELPQGEFKRKIAADRIKQLELQGAVKKEAAWLLEYWGGKTVGGIILMPATRHIFVHLNKSMRIKNKYLSK